MGALGLFLFGMNLMSESLQKIAGNRLRNALSAVTSNKVSGIFSGFFFTGLLQSSSAVTVLVVSFVNAGMISLAESVGLIMGANIGTTLKLWVIGVLGFGSTWNISLFLLPLIAASVPFFLSPGSRSRSTGEFLMGFALLFFGLQFLREQVPAVDPESWLLRSVFALNAGSDFILMLIFIGLGILLTIIFQSSSVTITLTIVLAMERWIPFELAAAMVLGENIGTTSTAAFASLVANNSARRAALIHILFNVTGVIWAIILFKPIISGIHYLLTGSPGAGQPLEPEQVPFGLAILHSGFNLVNTLLLAGFSGQLIRLTFLFIPSRGKKRERSRLKFIESNVSSVSELSIYQAKKEVVLMSKFVMEMFGIIPLLLIEKDPLVYKKLLRRVEKLEIRIDRMEEETSAYLSRIAQGKLSKKGTEELQALLRCVDEIESIGDACYKMSMVIRNKNDLKLYFIQDLRDNLQQIFDRVGQALEIMHHNLTVERILVRKADAVSAENEIDELRDALKVEHLQNLREDKYSHQTGIVYSELITQCEKIGDYALNVSEALSPGN